MRADHPGPTAPTLSPEAVPVWRDPETKSLFHAMPAGAKTLPLTIDGLQLGLPLPEGAAEIVRLIDGKRSLDKIRRQLPDRPDKAAFKARFEGLWGPLNGFSKLFVKR